MIYTITFSPSVDLFVETENKFNINGLTRYDKFELLAGGKGINASILLNRLDFDTSALTFLNGHFGNIIKEQLMNEKVEIIDFKSENETRINLKFNNNINNFEINGPKALISQESIIKLLEFINNKIQQKDVVMIMGNSDMNLVKQIVEILSKKNIKFILDIDNKEIINLLQYKPLAIKPNKDEVETLIDKKINSEEELINAGKKILKMGVENLLISCGGDGAYLFNKNVIYKAIFPKLKIINSAGAGDSMMAGFVSSLINGTNLEEAFLIANACGMATVSNKWIGTKKDVIKFKEQVKIIKL
ncbi:MAG: 1-phosphofructokinase [Metamycoplasmataceae bacterium]